MRKIKFRAWINIGGKLRKIENPDLQYMNGKYWIYLRREPVTCQLVDTDGETNILEQFTGLHDKNGKEIYEGDISQYGYVVRYNVEKGLFAEHDAIRNSVMSYPIDATQIRIVGNINENKELLK